MTVASDSSERHRANCDMGRTLTNFSPLLDDDKLALWAVGIGAR
jgi:hypothetical protein